MPTVKQRRLSVALAATAAASAAALLLIYEQEQQELTDKHLQEIRKYRYRLPLSVPEGGTEFLLARYSDVWCVEFLRFTPLAIRCMLRYLTLENIVYRNRYQCDPETALCVVLYRIAAPNRYKEDIPIFNRSRSWLSSIFNDVIEYLTRRYRNKLYWDSHRLTREQLQTYATAIELQGGVRNIWGFIDGTMRTICRPEKNQRLYYSGYKKAHAIKYQAVMTPDGLVSHLGGPFEGREGDWGMYIQLKLDVHLRQLNTVHGVDSPDYRLYMYGDPAYFASYGVFGAYRALPGRPLNPVLSAVNTHMSSMRISVEHGFAKVMSLWGFNGYKRQLQIGLSPVAAYFMVSVFFSNIHTCIYGSQTTAKFRCSPPTLGEYLYLEENEIR